jgi:uncharacterized membrane protein YagU involved in acid resistance
MQPNVTRVIAAGVVGTLVMTVVGLYVAPMMGMPPMNPAEMLAGAMGGMAILGWGAHLMIGIVLALIYAYVALPHLPGPAAARGALFSLAPWLMAQVVVIPMMGMGLFSGSMTMAGGSLIGHLVYGAVLGAIAGGVEATASDDSQLRQAATR